MGADLSEINVLAFALLDEIGKFRSKQLGRHYGGGTKHPESIGKERGFKEAIGSQVSSRSCCEPWLISYVHRLRMNE